MLNRKVIRSNSYCYHRFQLSGGIRVPLNKLNSTCPMDYPVGL